MAITDVALISCAVLWRRPAVRSGKKRSTIATRARSFSWLIGHEAGGAEGHDRAVVRRMIEAASREHEAVEMSDGQTHPHARRLALQHAARAAAVPVERRALPPEERRRAIGLAVDDVGDVAEHRRVEHGVDGRVVVRATIMQALDPVPRGQGIAGARAFAHGMPPNLLDGMQL